MEHYVINLKKDKSQTVKCDIVLCLLNIQYWGNLYVTRYVYDIILYIVNVNYSIIIHLIPGESKYKVLSQRPIVFRTVA